MKKIAKFYNLRLTNTAKHATVCVTGFETRQTAEAAAVTGDDPSEKNIVSRLLGRMGRACPGVSVCTFRTHSPLFRAFESAGKATESPHNKEAAWTIAHCHPNWSRRNSATPSAAPGASRSGQPSANPASTVNCGSPKSSSHGSSSRSKTSLKNSRRREDGERSLYRLRPHGRRCGAGRLAAGAAAFRRFALARPVTATEVLL